MALTIGVDFDNTIVSYDALFQRLAVEKKLVPPFLSSKKNEIRDYLRQSNNEDAWTELQGYVYGSRMKEADSFEGVINFFKTCLSNKKTALYIVSHKTRFPFLGEKYDLHQAAEDWLEANGFYNPKEIGLMRENVFFELTKEAKFDRIRKLNCDYFIDDLPEFLLDPAFPKNVQRILFDPHSAHPQCAGLVPMKSWNQILDFVNLASHD